MTMFPCKGCTPLEKGNAGRFRVPLFFQYAFFRFPFWFSKKRLPAASSLAGFTIIELLVVVAVSVAILVVIFSGLSSFRSTADLNRTLDGILAELREARQRSIEAQDQTQWGVHFESGRAVLFSGSSYVSGAVANSPFVLPATVTISAVALAGGAVDVVFSRIVGESSASGTVTIVLTRDASVTRVITIHPSGLAEVQ